MKKNKFYVELLLVFAIFNNPIIFYNYSYICYSLIYGIPLIYIILNFYQLRSYFRGMPLSIFTIVIWPIFALSLSFIIPTFYGTNDYSYVNVILAIYRRAIICVFLFMLIGKKYPQEAVVEQFMFYYACATALYVISTILFILFPALKNFWIRTTHLSSKYLELLKSFGYVGRFGWSGFAGFRNTIDATLSIIFLTYLEHNNRLPTQRYMALVIICFIGNLFYGRSGVLVSVICIVVGLILYKKLSFKSISMIILSTGSVVLVFIIVKSRVPAINEWYVWASTPFKNLIQTGSFNNYSADYLLKDMIFVPEGKTLWVGDGLYIDPVNGKYYMDTDSGFMRQILFWGILLSSITYFVLILSVYYMNHGVVLKILLLLMCVLFEIKGEVYYEMLPLFTIIALIDKKVFLASSFIKHTQNQIIMENSG